MLAFPGCLAWVGHGQVQTQELATALVQALLNDQEVVRAGALFLREASANPETQVRNFLGVFLGVARKACRPRWSAQ